MPASIQKIEGLHPIKGADRVVLAKILGWDCVVKKEDFSLGDLCVFIEIDSVLPDGPKWSEFLRDSRFRVKTRKIRGVVSQGLALPLTDLGLSGFKVGDDVAEVIGVTKYSKERSGQAGPTSTKTTNPLVPFPADVPRTDEPNLQNAHRIVAELVAQAAPFVATLKLDGSSATFINDALRPGACHGMLVCSRNNVWPAPRKLTPRMKSMNKVFRVWNSAVGFLRLYKKFGVRLYRENEDSFWWQIANKYKAAIYKLPSHLAVQGEIVGPQIQQNPLGLTELDFFVFNIWDTKAQVYLGWEDVKHYCQAFGFKHVPEMFTGVSSEFDFSKEKLWALSKGNYAGTNNPREGIVIKTIASRKPGELSFKLIHPDYLE